MKLDIMEMLQVETLKLDIGNAGGNMKLDIIGGNATGGNMKLD
jgi:hypothetical protein